MATPAPRWCAAAILLAGLVCAAAAPAAEDSGGSGQPVEGVSSSPPAEAPPATFVAFDHEEDASCQLRDGRRVTVHSTHPTRRIRVWLERYYRNVPTGDRSRSELVPGAEAEPLGCDTIMNASQEWRIARAIFLD